MERLVVNNQSSSVSEPKYPETTTRSVRLVGKTLLVQLPEALSDFEKKLADLTTLSI